VTSCVEIQVAAVRFKLKETFRQSENFVDTKMEQPHLTGKRHVFSLFKIQIKSKDNVSSGHAIEIYSKEEVQIHNF
jgi:hypothetical protein